MFYSKKEIYIQYATLYTSEINSKIERKNWTLIEHIREILTESGPPTYHWRDAIYTAIYIINQKWSEESSLISAVNLVWKTT